MCFYYIPFEYFHFSNPNPRDERWGSMECVRLVSDSKYSLGCAAKRFVKKNLSAKIRMPSCIVPFSNSVSTLFPPLC